MLMYNKQKKNNQTGNGNRLLISITVIGSAGPIRFVVNEEEVVANVMESALKLYSREGRLPILGSNIHDFFLYCPMAGTEALSPLETIGSFGVRNFMLCKKPPQSVQSVEEEGDGKQVTAGITRKNSGSWKSWFNKSLNLKVSSH